MADLFSKKHDDSTRGITRDAGDIFRRLGADIEELARSGDDDLLTKGERRHC